MSSDITFGTFVPQGWKGELAGVDGAEAQWQAAVDVAVRAEELGFDHIWVYDHVHNVPAPAQEAVFECWTTLAALSQRTSRIRLGQMVGCTSYRNPALLAKITSTLDVVSGGRLELGHRRRLVRAGVRRLRLRRSRPPGCASRCSRTASRSSPGCGPRARSPTPGRTCRSPAPSATPSRSGRPNVWIGGGGERRTLRVVAKHATHSNFGGSPEEWARRSGILDGHCAEVGRDPASITRTISGEIFLRETEAEVGTESRSFWGEPFETWAPSNFVGTPEQVCEKVQAYVDAGCGGFVPWCADYPDTETLELFATKVIPEFR